MNVDFLDEGIEIWQLKSKGWVAARSFTGSCYSKGPKTQIIGVLGPKHHNINAGPLLFGSLDP